MASKEGSVTLLIFVPRYSKNLFIFSSTITRMRVHLT